VRVRRKDNTLNDAIDYLDDVYRRADNNVQVAVSMLSEDELTFIYDETKKCLGRKYYLENYHCIRDEHGNWKTLYPWWDHQSIVYEVIEEEFAANGYCRIIVLKPRQTGISTGSLPPCSTKPSSRRMRSRCWSLRMARRPSTSTT
jgi:hypothetical protein